MGIGTTSPSAKLDVNGVVSVSPDTAGKNTFQLTTNASNDARLLMRSDTTTKVDIQANGSSYFNGGNVGIGATSPSAKLHLKTTGSEEIGIGLENSSRYYGIQTTGGNLTIKDVSAGGANRLLIDSSGNVSIGGTLSCTLANGVTATTQNASDNSTKVATTAYVDAATGGGGGSGGSFTTLTASDDVNFDSGTFFVDASANKVGIGTASPSYQLDVFGSSAVSMVRTNDTTSPTLGLFVNSGSNGVGTISVDNGGHMTFDTGANGAGQLERMRIDSSGRVGIGTSSLVNPLEVALTSNTASKTTGSAFDGAAIRLKGELGPSTNSEIAILAGLNDTLSAGIGFLRESSSTWGTAVKFYTRKSATTGSIDDIEERMRIDSSGNVGIGTDNPTTPLQVQADGIGIKLDGSSNTTKSIFFRQTNAANPAQVYADGSLRLFTEDSGTDIRFHVNSNGSTNEKMRVNATGVGIGTISPSSPLSVNKDTGTTSAYSTASVARIEGGFNLNEIGGIGFGYAGSDATSKKPHAFIGSVIEQWTNYSKAGLVFATRGVDTDTEPVERMRIDNDGKVGIGTSSPSAKLSVSGNAFISSDSFMGENAGLFFSGFNDYGAGVYGRNSGNDLVINAGAGEKARVTSAGNFGIGETSPDVLLHVGTGSIYQNKTGSGVFPGLSDTTSHGFMAESQGAAGSTIHVSRTNSAAGNFSRQGTGDVVVFRNTSGSVTEAGSIEITGATSVLYQTSSDYRLKENVVDVSDGIDRVKQLNPVRFNFIGEDPVVDGFLAHEVQDVVPEAIGGEKDGMKDEEYMVSPAVYEDVVHPAVDAVYEDVVHPATYEEVVHPAVEATYDEDGNELTPAVEEYTEQVLLTEEYTEQVLVTEAVEEYTESVLVTEAVMGTRSVPDYQGIDQSKLVPLLTAALQEAVAKIEALEARVATLEG